MYPHELTFGVFDGVACKKVLTNSVVWVKDINPKSGTVHLSLIDGGTRLESTNDARARYYMRGATSCTPPPRAGDVLRLSSYRIQFTTSKEPVIVISQFEVVRHVAVEQPIPSQLYPHLTAQSDLQRIEEECSNAAYRKIDPRTSPQHQQQQETSLHNSERQFANPYSANSPVNDFASANNQQSGSTRPPNLYPTLPTQLSMKIQQNPYAELQPNPFSSNSNNANMNQRPTPQRPTPAMNQAPESYGPVRRGAYESNAANTVNPQRAAPFTAQYRSTGPVAHRVDGQYVAIKDLTSFLGRWSVKGRFVNVGEPRNYTNQRGEGKIWNFDLVDSKDEAGSIRCTMFNKAVEKFFPIIRENQIFTVSRGQIQPANKKFYSGSHQYELFLGEDCDIQWIAADDPTIPIKNAPGMVPISHLSTLAKNTSVSVCGVLLKCSDIVEITSRSTGRPQDKRDITIVDESGVAVDMTLWGNKAYLIDQQNINPAATPVLLIEDARVDEYNGRRLSSVGQTSLTVSSQATPEGQRLRQWFDMEGRRKMGSFTSLTTSGWSDQKGEGTRATIAEMRHATTVMPEGELEDKGAWFTCRASLTKIYRDRQFYWVACPTCRKKVSYPNAPNDGFMLDETSIPHCAACQKDVEHPVKMYMLSMDIADSTGSLNCVAMGEKGLQVMGGITADALAQLNQEGEDVQSQHKRFSDYFNDRIGRLYVFRLQAKMERYRDEATVKYRVFAAEPIGGDEIDAIMPTTENQTMIQPAKSAMAVMRQQIIKDANSSLEWIYQYIPKKT